jgi:hypothetical protein
MTANDQPAGPLDAIRANLVIVTARTETREEPLGDPVPVQPRGEPFMPTAVTSVSVHDCSIGYAAGVLADLGLGDWPWLIHDLAEAMDAAAVTAAEAWISDHRAELENAACWPRWCPCGKWPDFGIGCWYHGPCECVEVRVVSANLQGPSYSAPVLAYSGFGWRDNFRPEPPALSRGCPVHPNGPIPGDVLEVWRARWHGDGSLLIGGERGLPTYCGTTPAKEPGHA